MRIRLIAVSYVIPLAVACANSSAPTQPGAISVPVEISAAAQPDGVPHNFRTHATGDEEVPANGSAAQGQAIFQLSPDGDSLHYRVNVANIENVTQSHIHCGLVGTNGPIVLWLYPAAPPLVLIPGRSQGTIGEGTATNANVIPRAANAACPGGVANFDDLVAKLRSGGAYVNVHTSQIPGGEVRGQID